MGPTETLAQFVVDTHLGDIPSKAVEISKLVILDVLGVTRAAVRQPVARMLRDDDAKPYARGAIRRADRPTGERAGHRCFDDMDEWRNS
jgi:2-methylcitrate dehydratase PrpD